MFKNNKKKLALKIIYVVISLTVIGLVIYGIRENEDYWKSSMVQDLTLIIAILISFWANNYKSDVRKSKEHIERILLKIQTLVSNNEFYCIRKDQNSEEAKKTILITNRSITNYIEILKEYPETKEIKDKIEYIENEFNKYKEITGDHIQDLEYLSKTEKEFKKISENITYKCESIIVSLYK